MSELAPALPRPAPSAARGWGGTVRFLVLVALATLAFRTFVVMPRSIPSESMLPGLQPGDYVLVAKWRYGWSRFSPPVALGRPHGRLMGRAPARGDVVVFRAPPGERADYVKRVIGLPGDTVQMRGGVPWLNGRAIDRAALPDLILPIAANTECRTVAPAPWGRGIDADGRAVCRLPRYRETLPGGRSYDVIDQGWSALDDTPAIIVPAGRYLMLGDNRDVSLDSRVAPTDGGIGLVPAENIEGQAVATFFATGGSLRDAVRWARIGRWVR